MRPGSDALQALSFFSGLAAKDLSALNEVADLARVGPHEVLFRQGDRLQGLTILTAGFVTETADELSGEAFTNVHSPVALVGAASALLGVPASAGAKTISSSRLIIIPAMPLRHMITPARFVLPFEKQFLAAKIGCSQENLSRAFATLRRVGVETKRSIVVLRDIVALKAFADAQPVEQVAPPQP